MDFTKDDSVGNDIIENNESMENFTKNTTVIDTSVKDADVVISETTSTNIQENDITSVVDNKKDIVILHNKHKNNRLAAILMVKNESFRIQVTLTSLLGFITTIIIYDTGSTDDTVDIIVNFCKKYKLSLYVKHGTFVDFSTSRNVLISYADTVPNIDFFLMLDCNDELQNGADLVKYCKNAPNNNAFFLKQSWKSSINIHYYNIRLIRSNGGWRYKGVVHEYICKEGEDATIRIPNVVLFQDRTQDDNKSALRFKKDRELLLGEYNSEDKTPRTVYYLAQTYECLDDKENAIKYYSERMHMLGYYEERYQAAYHVGMIYRDMGKPFEEYSGYFLFSFGIMHRSEPLVRIAEHYISKNQWTQAYYYIKEACKIEIPDCGLFLDYELYNYYRWHLMGIVAYYVHEYKDGLKACSFAIEKRNNDIDKHNLEFYKNELSGKDLCTKMSLL